jgi:hypothetical protein
MPQTQGGGTVYGIGPGTNLRGPLALKRMPCAANSSVIDFVGLFDANGAPVAPTATGGIVIPSANLDPQIIQYQKTTITAAIFKTLFTTPVSLIAAPGAGKFIQLFDALIYVNFNSAQYTAGGVLSLLVGGASLATVTAALINAAAGASTDVIQPTLPLVGTGAVAGLANTALTISAATQNFATGDSPVNVHLWYAVVTL